MHVLGADATALMRIARLQRELNAGSTIQEILRHLVTNTLNPHLPKYAFIAECDLNGAYCLLEHFGAESGLPKHLAEINPNSPHPLSLAIESSHFVCIEADSIGKSAEKSTVYQPLIHMDGTTRVLVMGFAERLNYDQNLIIFYDVVSQMLVNHLTKNSFARPFMKLESSAIPHTSSALSEINLSERQLQIAEMITKGMTNRQISRQLGFTEATVRYETIKLYERLRVRNRAEASSRIREIINK